MKQGQRKGGAQCIQELHALWDHFVTIRAAFPYLKEEHIGRTSVQSTRFYQRMDKKLSLSFSHPLSRMDIERLNAAGHWVNQSFIVRLHALLEYHGMLKKIDHAIDGGRHVDMTNRLRQIFAHTNGRYNRDGKGEAQLMERLMNEYNITDVIEGRYPLPIDRVPRVLYRGAVQYVQGKMNIEECA